MSASILQFPRRVPRCEHCGWLVPRGSATESIHHQICTLPRQKAARIAAYQKQRWQEAQAKAAPRRVATTPRRALPPPEPHKSHGARRLALRIGLDWPEYRERLAEAARLPAEALERVADGRSTMGATAWRRVLAVLD